MKTNSVSFVNSNIRSSERFQTISRLTQSQIHYHLVMLRGFNMCTWSDQCGFYLEFKAVMVLPTITHNYGNYPYGNYVGNALVGKVITLNT